MSIETRLRRLELLVGDEEHYESKATAKSDDLHRRLQALELKFAAANSTTTENDSMAATSQSIDDLLQDLSPGTALTHQKQIVAPILYRQQMILACEEQLRKDHSRLREILSLLSIDTQNESNKKTCSEDTVTNAPILLLKNCNNNKDGNEKVERWAEILNDLHLRSINAGNRLDAMVSAHNLIIAGLSERLVEISERWNQIANEKSK